MEDEISPEDDFLDQEDLDASDPVAEPQADITETGSTEVFAQAIELWVNKSFTEPPRLDQYIAARQGDLSRAAVQRLIDEGNVQVNQKPTKASYRVQTGDCISVRVAVRRSLTLEPEEIPLNILYEDESLVVINKPADMIVHPGRGIANWRGTLANALLFHFQHLSRAGGDIRPGIVHRLDRDTTGVIVVAKNDQVHQHLGMQFETRKVVKEYIALCYGVPDRQSDYVEKRIGHHPSIREKMAIREDPRFGKVAVTFYETAEKFAGYSYIRLRPQTGRTHQLRVHMTHIGCPLIADRPYSGRAEMRLSELTPEFPENPVLINRQALHAHRLRFFHPVKKQVMDFTADFPNDITHTLAALREYAPAK
jgi:23S rRNA pseudouridine1911/1915/1917 synthase